MSYLKKLQAEFERKKINFKDYSTKRKEYHSLENDDKLEIDKKYQLDGLTYDIVGENYIIQSRDFIIYKHNKEDLENKTENSIILNKNKKIRLGIAVAMIISLFLPFLKLGALSMSLIDGISQNATLELLLLILMVIVFGVLTFMDKYLGARICSGLVLSVCLYAAFKMASLGIDFNIFSLLGIGAYLLLLSSIAGVIFSKPEK